MALIKTRADYYKPTMYFEVTQPNPTEKKNKCQKGDCCIRAHAIVHNLTWQEAYNELVEQGRKNFCVPNDVTFSVFPLYRSRGYEETVLKAQRGKNRVTAEEFAKQHPTGVYFLQVANHVTAVIDGKVRDAWNCGNKCVYRYFRIK